MKAFINANIITMDPDNMNATAMVVEDGTIIAIGTNEEIHKSLNYGEEIIDLKGGQLSLASTIAMFTFERWPSLKVSRLKYCKVS